MDLQELHRRSGIRPRKLRYTLDHNLLPGVKIDLAPREAGRPRQFGADVAFGILCAVHLLELGVSHKQIRLCLGGLAEIPFPGRGRRMPLIAVLMERSFDACARFSADGSIRILSDEISYDSLWCRPDGKADRGQKLEPPVYVTLNLQAIRDQILAAV